jgi:membrane-associated protease RseP (regulator of RpoE activity)
MRLALAAALALATTLPAHAQGKPEKPSTTVGFSLEANLIWMKVTFDGKGPFRMVFDTGASTTVLLPEVAKKAGLAKEPKGLFGETTEFVKVKETKVGDLTLKDLKIAVMKVPQLTTAAALMEMEADGVLGFNFIARFETTIDYKNQSVRFVENGFAPPDPEESLPGIRKPPKAWMGIQVEEADSETVARHGYDGGVRINHVTELGPAEKAGLREGDIIVEMGGVPITKPSALRDHLMKSSSGQVVPVLVIRDGFPYECNVELERYKE